MFFDFGDIKVLENSIKQTWYDYRAKLALKEEKFDEVFNIEDYVFLKQYDDLFHKNSGFALNTIEIKALSDKYLFGRGTILKPQEIPEYERFIPKKEYIKNVNRFSPPGIEWLYLAVGNEKSIHECSQNECRAKSGDRFGFCHFAIDVAQNHLKLCDLTIADEYSYETINNDLEEYAQRIYSSKLIKAMQLGYNHRDHIDEVEFKKQFTRWGVRTYSKLLSEQIFIPVSNEENKTIHYLPFQSMANYYKNLGYSGIVYKSTVCQGGKNIVLFDKCIAKPVGQIEEYYIQ